eukprot:TRINITY_DN8069_c0_g1_i1.p1 TRINITY_DN8069_c0_g1~~TRINITY_DN8069_c0_g1_i1.p1  ORF type:complete len:317 (+),score=55.91 TRINITY_DN8069_c0_g1_i1:98-952(+)
MVWVPDHIWKAQKGTRSKGAPTVGNFGPSWQKGASGWGKDGAMVGWGKGAWGKGAWGKGAWGKGAWGKGAWGKGAWGKGVKKAPREGDIVQDDFVLNTAEVHTGTIEKYWKLKGYGFVILDRKGVIPGDKCFLFWKNINSADRFPMLVPEMQVQFTLNKKNVGDKTTIEAINVSLVGGAPVAIQDTTDEKKDFVGGQYLRYTGKLKFYLPDKGFGYIEIDDGFIFDRENVPKEIRAERAEMNANGGSVALAKDLQVEFGIWKTQKDAFKAYNVTLPGGTPLPQE